GSGDSGGRPTRPVASVLTLRESVLPPARRAPAADTKITIGAEASTTTIHNAKAAVVTTPTAAPSVPVLPATGRPAGSPSLPWPAIALLGLIAVADGALDLRRRRLPQPRRSYVVCPPLTTAGPAVAPCAPSSRARA